MRIGDFGEEGVYLLEGPPGREWGGGIYVLLLDVEECTLSVGSLGEVRLKGGYAAYIGSAVGGFSQRVRRHFRRGKRLRWHIDYLTERFRPVRVVLLPGATKELEEALALELARRLPFAEGFGSSDDRSESHLFFSDSLEVLIRALLQALQSLVSPPSPGGAVKGQEEGRRVCTGEDQR